MCIFHKWEKYLPYFSSYDTKEETMCGVVYKYKTILWSTKRCTKCGKIKKYREDSISHYNLESNLLLTKKLRDKNILTDEDFKIQKLKDK